MDNKGAVAIVLVIITVGIGVAGFTILNMPPADNTTTTDTTTDTGTTTTTTTDPGYTGPPIILRYTDLIDLNIEVPNWSFPMTDGTTFRMNDHLGEVILIDFMATWCYWCGEQNAELIELWETHSDQITLISVSATTSDTLTKLSDYADDRGLEWPHGRDVDGEASDFVGVPGIPSLIMVDTNGLLRYFHVGYPFLYEDTENDDEVHSILEVLEWITG